MYGEECLAVTLGRGTDLGRLVSDVTDLIIDDDDREDIRAFGEAMRSLRQDSMGLGMVYYWPGIPFVGADEQED